MISEIEGLEDVQAMSEDPKQADNLKNHNAPSAVVMETSVTPDDVMRAGGLGATDDIAITFPVARDSTDFESTLLNIRESEDSGDKIPSGQNILDFSKVDSKDTQDANGASVNMEAFVTSDEVMRAGGFGATDDISSFLPVASDFTDFEANLRGAREYEDLNEEINRPGLGWTNEVK